MPIRPGNLLRHSCKDDMSSEISTEKSGKNNLTLEIDTRGAKNNARHIENYEVIFILSYWQISIQFY